MLPAQSSRSFRPYSALVSSTCRSSGDGSSIGVDLAADISGPKQQRRQSNCAGSLTVYAMKSIQERQDEASPLD